ncbi:hypothetical protein VOLCADRAFT_116782 [Volvox carteri f. nagariensis]|uniref:Phosphoglycerate mutase-like protein n=1 Tax=Volvox carteri f. nagariensis TaxID=3068 RepID=D8TPE4_VOLCA|nr:uncharacterized protein VOLCADRAFT_116782 [Volvox carteri f. nagariensis]EFJ50602.1 hypothetical protein VOLCADRAFT_116782 [Volvox carteri f. nagariensis]|eukprot:XP_002948195.1 hypothetical protein VOLCADRAFT_116782 [Volvox carteri f. nagariensis]
MAAYMALHKYGSPHQEPLRDPLMYDTVLTREGLRKVQHIAPRVAALEPRPEVVLISPLTRCLQTAVAACELLVEQTRVPLLAEPLLRERVVLSSEIGRPRGELRGDFPGLLKPSTGMRSAVQPTRRAQPGPTTQVYEKRLAALRGLLAGRPERCMLLVAHWGVLQALTGAELQPGEMASAEVQL